MSKSDIVNNLSSFLCYLQTQVDTVCGSTTRSKDFLLLSSSIGKSSDNVEITVSTTSALPNLYQSSIPSGMIVYIEDIDIPVISSNESWYTFDGILVRSDAPVRTLYTWGDGFFGELGDGTVLDRCSPGTVAGGGTTWCWVSSGYKNHFAIKTDGTLWSWGSNNAGQLGDGTTVSRCSPGTVSVISSWVVSASGGKYHSTAISENATTVRSLTSYESTNNIPQKLYNAWTWGANNCGQLGDNSFTTKCSPSTVNTNSTICKFKAAGYNTFRAQTALYIGAAGDNSFGQLGNCTNKTCSSFVTPCTTLANRSNEITSDTLRPNFCNITSNGKTAMSVTVDGKLWTWGYNANGILANQSTSNRCYPGLTCIGGNTWNQVSLGLCHVIANTSETL